MKYLLLLFPLLFVNAQSQTHTLTVTIHNIENVKGTLEIGLFNSNERFLEEGQAYKSKTVKVKNTSETFVIKDIPPGTYAISMFQDLNDDKICNQNLFGIPKEPYAFSNNFKPKFSAPSFEDCQFNLTSDKSLRIELMKF
ncbi:hypothetical protein Aeqsu_0091 [Aequorivita sublithincola DSM 14238]|uniref:DUF2141 domain-containing protein n=1 Tax=Aequorivita sublithincola (strain DSM 14238 / LMG 21431 / ACAM 643 / 9-3) TaxID=746697 RepID=I3YRK3_AEQSU|nr:DUF2141 domain-containing protein [Aequorivita sublithincola]AFL79621.1 hypothetical protein Aeqsu_0091 [Aequorivita sublithincola DSM 14238]